MTTSGATADVSLPEKAATGVFSVSYCSIIWSFIDLDVSTLGTTDGGINLSFGEDFGGGQIANYVDKELDTQRPGFASPTVVI